MEPNGMLGKPLLLYWPRSEVKGQHICVRISDRNEEGGEGGTLSVAVAVAEAEAKMEVDVR